MSSQARKNRQRLAGIRRRERIRVLVAVTNLDRLAHDDFEPWDDDRDGEYMGHVGCLNCGGEGFVVVCMDDLCRGGGSCIHGDGEKACGECHGEGAL